LFTFQHCNGKIPSGIVPALKAFATALIAVPGVILGGMYPIDTFVSQAYLHEYSVFTWYDHKGYKLLIITAQRWLF
jgi:hypothetical protein